MKKYLAAFLFLLLLLSGCKNQEPEQSQSTTEPLVTLPPAYYEQNSALETATAGAVKQFRLPNGKYSNVFCVGEELLLMTDSEPIQLQMLIGENCIPIETLSLDGANPIQCRGLSNGFVYYDEANHMVQYLDMNLTQRNNVVLTSDMTSPVISPDGNHIYYCIGEEIRALDVEKNISRLLKVQSADKQKLLDTCFNGGVLCCLVENPQGEESVHYISTDDGKKICEDDRVSCLYTYDDRYLARWQDGTMQWWISGIVDGDAVRFLPQEENLYGAPGLKGAIGYEANENGLSLHFYELTTGKKTAQITLQGIGMPEVIQEDPRDNSLWLIVTDPVQGGKLLLKWSIGATPVTEDVVYTDVLYTAEDPDTEAIADLKERAEEISAKYSVEIRIWKDALATAGGHTLEPEHNAEAIAYMLDQLEGVLQEFPGKFVSKSIRNTLRICLVRTVDGEPVGQQYWNGRTAYIAVCSGDHVRDDFLKGFGLVVDSHVLGNSPVYDYWDTLNPSDFFYGKPDESLISGENPTFVDMDAMKSGMFDRSRVFWQAMMPDNKELFSGETMQKKLSMLCKAIRDAWGWEKKSDVYPWEQYLEEPIAAKK